MFYLLLFVLYYTHNIFVFWYFFTYFFFFFATFFVFGEEQDMSARYEMFDKRNRESLAGETEGNKRELMCWKRTEKSAGER